MTKERKAATGAVCKAAAPVAALLVCGFLAACSSDGDNVTGDTFTMGSPSSEPGRYSNETQHQVTLSTFRMEKYPVTQKEWADVMGSLPDDVRDTYGKGDNYPVYGVTWYDAVEYCNKLSEKEDREKVYTITNRSPTTDYPITSATVTADWSKKGYRLPTEAEWEYACRAGTTTPFSTGNNITTDQANYDGNYLYNGNAAGTYRGKTTEVGSFAANPWGLYDMHGNVWEWCWDWYGDYSTGGKTDPKGANSGSNRVRRGGSWNYDRRYLRSAYRGNYAPGISSYLQGFRLAYPEF